MKKISVIVFLIGITVTFFLLESYFSQNPKVQSNETMIRSKLRDIDSANSALYEGRKNSPKKCVKKLYHNAKLNISKDELIEEPLSPLPREIIMNLNSIYEEQGLEGLLDYILIQNIDINRPYNLKNYRTFLGELIFSNEKDAKKLIETGIVDLSVHKDLLSTAVLSGNAEMLRYLVDKGIPLYFDNVTGKSLYKTAALIGDVDLLMELDDLGLHDASLSSTGRNALTLAICRKKVPPDVLDYLYAKGFTIDKWAYYDAAKYGSVTSFDFLRKNTADLTDIHIMGQSMLDIAIETGRSMDFIKILEKEGFEFTENHLESARLQSHESTKAMTLYLYISSRVKP